jgi:hypothetical protein
MNTMTAERPPLTQIIGTVVFKSPAPAGNKPGKIKLEDGKFLYAFADKLQMIEIGGTYDFGCAINGVYNNVKVVRPLAPQQQAFQQSPHRPQQQRSAPVPNQPPRLSDIVHMNELENAPRKIIEYNRPTHPRDAERMFTCSILNAFIQTGRIDNDVAALTDAVRKLRQVWQETFGLDGE